ncbi:hypothetical protein NP493_8480g00001 [Ridgeia piscesae]|uniref:Uncharacterized protein n=1 Tax=Ridgeia piscesae TaxID=27915 RepID=A0AAD9IMX4_RIDPI|nr:hypothetical protein NP493_8480g00001 [Ridgeia piscesae]
MGLGVHDSSQISRTLPSVISNGFGLQEILRFYTGLSKSSIVIGQIVAHDAALYKYPQISLNISLAVTWNYYTADLKIICYTFMQRVVRLNEYNLYVQSENTTDANGNHPVGITSAFLSGDMIGQYISAD